MTVKKNRTPTTNGMMWQVAKTKAILERLCPGRTFDIKDIVNPTPLTLKGERK